MATQPKKQKPSPQPLFHELLVNLIGGEHDHELDGASLADWIPPAIGAFMAMKCELPAECKGPRGPIFQSIISAMRYHGRDKDARKLCALATFTLCVNFRHALAAVNRFIKEQQITGLELGSLELFMQAIEAQAEIRRSKKKTRPET